MTVNIRAAVPGDAEAITRVFMESAQYHASLEPERYWIPAADAIVARYREGRQHPQDAEGITLVAELGGAIAGFVDARLEQSTDAMHRDFIFCFIADVAVSRAHQSHGIGGHLLEAAEDWGRRHGAQYSSLQYLAANPRAGDLYRRKGYHVASMMAIKRL